MIAADVQTSRRRRDASSLEVCIIGAGLAGLSVAAAAGERGVGSLTIVEAKDEVKPLGGGIILQPNAVHALDRLGCLDTVRSAAAPLTHIVQVRAGAPVSIALGEVWPRLRLPTLAVHRHVLHAVLLERASRHATVELSREVVGVRDPTGERPEVELADGSARAYDLVVAADGIQSAIRRAIAPETQVRALGLWWARWLVSAGSAIRRSWHTERLGRAVVGTFPLGADELQVFATVPSDAMSDERRQATLASLESESSVLREADAHGMRLVHVGPAREVRPHVWRAGGVAFAGDAAHAMSPTLSAGGSMAIEDGLVLGRLLGTGDVPAEITSRYERLRKQRLAWMARVGQVQVYTLGGTPSALSRSELTRQLRLMYEPLDDPDYLPHDLVR